MVTLTPTVPGAPRTETVLYGSGRSLPDPDATPRERLDDARDLAARYLRSDVGISSESIIDLCEAIETLDLRLIDASEALRVSRMQTEVAQGTAAAIETRLAECRALLADQQELRRAALEDAEQQRAIAIRLSAENRELRLAAAVVVVVDVAPLARLTGYTAPDGYDATDLDTVVCSMEDVP